MLFGVQAVQDSLPHVGPWTTHVLIFFLES